MAKKEKENKTETKTKKSGVIIKPCNCTSIFQDEKYGKGMRVFNQGPTKAYCTVCDRSL